MADHRGADFKTPLPAHASHGSPPGVESRNTHDDGGGSAVVTMGAVATAAIAESAADAVGATRIGHAARSLARARLAHEAGDGRETAVAAAATKGRLPAGAR